MEMTITLECMAEKREDLRELEHELKQIHGLKVFLIEPEDADAPTLISISLFHRNEQTNLAIRRIAHTFYEFVHSSAREPGRQRIVLVTSEGQSINLVPLGSDQMRQVIAEAYADQSE